MEKRCNEKENRVYEYLVSYTEENLFPPTVGEIKTGCNIRSNATVYDVLGKLEKKGQIKIKRCASRGIQLQGYKLVKIEE